MRISDWSSDVCSSDLPHLDAVRERAAGEGAEVVPVSAAIEEEFSQLDDADRDEFLASIGLEEPGLNRVIRAAYKLLGLQTRSEEHTSELQSLMRPSYAVFCLQTKIQNKS